MDMGSNIAKKTGSSKPARKRPYKIITEKHHPVNRFEVNFNLSIKESICFLF